MTSLFQIPGMGQVPPCPPPLRAFMPATVVLPDLNCHRMNLNLNCHRMNKCYKEMRSYDNPLFENIAAGIKGT